MMAHDERVVLVDALAAAGDLASLERLRLGGVPLASECAPDLAAAAGHLPVLRWLRRHMPHEGTAGFGPFNQAVCAGHLRVAKWLHRDGHWGERTGPGLHGQAVRGAIARRDADTLRWLWRAVREDARSALADLSAEDLDDTDRMWLGSTIRSSG